MKSFPFDLFDVDTSSIDVPQTHCPKMAEDAPSPGRMAAADAVVGRHHPLLTLDSSSALLGDLLVGAGELWARQEALNRATNAMAAALAWLHNAAQRSPGAGDARSHDNEAVWSQGTGEGGSTGGEEPPSASSSRARLTEMLVDAFDHWHQQQMQSGAQGLPMQFWLLWVELGCSISAAAALDTSAFPPMLQRRGSQAIKAVTRAASVGSGALLPAGFPTSSSHCDRQGQEQFCVGLWNAAVRRPLQSWSARGSGGSRDSRELDDVSALLLTGFVAWVARAMSGSEIVFLAATEQAIGACAREYAQASVVSRQVLDKFLATHIAQPYARNAAAIAVSSVVATGLCSQDRENAALVDSRLEKLRNEIAQKMILTPFPHVQDPLTIVAAGLGMAVWGGDSSCSPSASRTVVQVLAVVRVALLPLLSSRIATDERRLGEATQRLLTELHAPTADQSQDTIDLVYRVLESGVTETIGFFNSSSAQNVVLVSALQSAMPSELFRSMLNAYVSAESKKNTATTSTTQAGFPLDKVLSLLKHLYDVVAPISLKLSEQEDGTAAQPFGPLVRSFSLLTRLEFAREVWASPLRNQAMNAITHRIEEAIDQAPDAVFPAIFGALHASLAGNTDLWAGSSEEKAVPDDVNVARGCQILAVSLLIQRKLRALLVQSTNRQLLDDAIAVVFLGVNSAFEPLDTFAHQFLGVCLTHLAQFVSMYSIVPYYVQLSLPAFPSSVTQQTIAAVCGSVFGALFYSQANAGSNAEVARRMTLWTVKQFINRSKELLLPDADDSGASSVNSDGLYLVGLMAEITKMSPLVVVDKAAMELEALVRDCDEFDQRHQRQVCSQVKRTILTSISQNCEAEKRAWLAAWFIELEHQYPSAQTGAADQLSTTASRL